MASDKDDPSTEEDARRFSEAFAKVQRSRAGEDAPPEDEVRTREVEESPTEAVVLPRLVAESGESPLDAGEPPRDAGEETPRDAGEPPREASELPGAHAGDPAFEAPIRGDEFVFIPPGQRNRRGPTGTVVPGSRSDRGHTLVAPGVVVIEPSVRTVVVGQSDPVESAASRGDTVVAPMPSPPPEPAESSPTQRGDTVVATSSETLSGGVVPALPRTGTVPAGVVEGPLEGEPAPGPTTWAPPATGNVEGTGESARPRFRETQVGTDDPSSRPASSATAPPRAASEVTHAPPPPARRSSAGRWAALLGVMALVGVATYYGTRYWATQASVAAVAQADMAGARARAASSPPPTEPASEPAERASAAPPSSPIPAGPAAVVAAGGEETGASAAAEAREGGTGSAGGASGEAMAGVQAEAQAGEALGDGSAGATTAGEAVDDPSHEEAPVGADAGEAAGIRSADGAGGAAESGETAGGSKNGREAGQAGAAEATNEATPSDDRPAGSSGPSSGEEARLARAASARRIRQSGDLWVSREAGEPTRWTAARRRCDSFEVDGVTGWRLPYRRELTLLGHIGVLDTETYWTDSSNELPRGQVWVFDGIHRSLEPASKAEGAAEVVCVRPKTR